MAKSPEQEHPHKAFGWAATDTSGKISPFNFSRRYIFFIYRYTHAFLYVSDLVEGF